MALLDREWLDVIPGQVKLNKQLHRQWQIHFADLHLDLHFPHTGNAEEKTVLRILQRSAKRRRQSGRLIKCPDEDLGVKE